MYPPLKRSLVSALCAALPALAAHAQTTPAPDPSSTATLPAVTVNATPGSAAADVSGFGDVPLRELPMAVTVVDQQQLQDSGARRLADLTAFDASVSDCLLYTSRCV